MKHSEYSAVIIGSGIAGLYAALKLSRTMTVPDGILILTKSELGESNSKYAQGGIVGVLKENKVDHSDLHINDTLKAGVGLNNIDVVKYISELSDEVINDLMTFGVEFDKDSNGNLNFTLEAAHSVRRILHVGGDATGKCMVNSLVKKINEDPNITVVENAMAVELLINSENECKGLILYNDITNEHEIVYTSATVIATGGVGQVYKYTTNPDCATGDGIDLAFQAGATIEGLEFIQFHPTALALSSKNKNRFLISEAVRGEGAKLVNANGEEFMVAYHDKRELAPRDIVTRAIFNEMKKNNTSNMFLNASIIDKAKLLMRFPTISSKCLDNGIDISKSLIPVAPAAHYTMGGIKATVQGKTSVKGLYAIGEAASTGFHGANRLASNSLLECVVCAYELADWLSFANLTIPKKIDSKIMNTLEIYSKPINESNYNIADLKANLKDIMWDNVGIIRSEDSMLKASKEIMNLKKEFKRNRKCLNKSEYEYRNMLTVAELIIEAALARKESIGAHCRKENFRINTLNNNKELINVK